MQQEKVKTQPLSLEDLEASQNDNFSSISTCEGSDKKSVSELSIGQDEKIVKISNFTYDANHPLGSGNFATVYKGKDEKGEEIAIKVEALK